MPMPASFALNLANRREVWCFLPLPPALYVLWGDFSLPAPLQACGSLTRGQNIYL